MSPRHSIERLADDAPVPHAGSWPARRPPSLAYARACAAIEAQARRTATAMVKARARTYAAEQRDLEAVGEELSLLSPSSMIDCIARLKYELPRYRHFGFGGYVPAINLMAAMLYARWLRRVAHRNAGRSA